MDELKYKADLLRMKQAGQITDAEFSRAWSDVPLEIVADHKSGQQINLRTTDATLEQVRNPSIFDLSAWRKDPLRGLMVIIYDTSFLMSQADRFFKNLKDEDLFQEGTPHEGSMLIAAWYSTSKTDLIELQVIPRQVLSELDGLLKSDNDEKAKTASHARQAVAHLLKTYDCVLEVDIPTSMPTPFVENHLQAHDSDVDDLLVRYAVNVANSTPGCLVVLATNDAGIAITIERAKRNDPGKYLNLVTVREILMGNHTVGRDLVGEEFDSHLGYVHTEAGIAEMEARINERWKQSDEKARLAQGQKSRPWWKSLFS